VQTLEAERGTRLTTKSPEHDFAKEIAAAASARARLDKANATLRERVASMEDEMETLRFELEEVRAAAGMDSAA
jgi:predicted RNase H-like nuclease (RuvC/YqgF family)